jgi:hypothetical protein
MRGELEFGTSAHHGKPHRFPPHLLKTLHSAANLLGLLWRVSAEYGLCRLAVAE